jgi:hypothetical protein
MVFRTAQRFGGWGGHYGARMRLETKFLRLKTPVTIGSRFGEWRVYWLGGWARNRLSYLVMLVRVTKPDRGVNRTVQRL